ncbi:MAG: arsenic resistance protein [Spirochaetota bacterium]
MNLDRFNLIFRKYILLWALLAMVVGYLAGRFNQQRVLTLRALLIPLLFLMIFIMAFSVRLSSLLKLGSYRSQILASFILSVLSPLLCILITRIIPQRFQFLRTGMVISSTVPPEAMLSAWTAFLEGDILLTLIIQSFTFIYYLFLIPFGLTALLENITQFSMMILIKNLVVLIVIPFGLAGALQLLFRGYLNHRVMVRLKPTLSSLSGMIELFVIMIAIALHADIIADNPVIIMWGVLTGSLYYAATFVAALLLTRLFRFDYQTSVPLVYQNGCKNLPVAMVIALSTFEGQVMLGVAACLLVQFPVSALFYTVFTRLRESGRL